MPEYEDYIDIGTFVSKLTDSILAPRLEYKEEARKLAEAFAMELKIYIQNNESGITGQNEAYLNKKLEVVGHTMPLVLTYQYVNSIKVFEDKSGKAVPTPENGPRYYVPVVGYKSCFGFYVDVEDIWHDPSPMHKGTGKGMHEYLKEGKSQRRVDTSKFLHEALSDVQNNLIKIRREEIKRELQRSRASKKGGSNKLQLIGMRQLKKLLEYGQRDKNGEMLFTAHWEPVIARFDEIAMPARERWLRLSNKFVRNKKDFRTDIDDKEL